ncbi:MAG: MFS transporter [Thermodesulfobacteriota bacterium]
MKENMTVPKTRVVLSSHYFLYFGILGIYLPYFNLYCYHLDFSGLQIGVLSALRTFSTALFPLVWGVLADRYNIRRPIFITCTIAAAAIWFLYLLTTDFTLMLLITAAYGVFYAPIISFLESFSMELLGKRKSDYGHLRVWGSLSFILVVILVGRLIDMYSATIILVLILTGSVLQSILSPAIPRVPAQVREKSFAASAKMFLNRRALTFLFCAFLMLASHGTYYGFFSIHLEQIGYGGAFIGFAWALASIAEISVMVGSAKIFSRFSFEKVLIFSFFAAALRWVLLAGAESALPILFAQLFHAFTYGSFHVASILYIDKLAPPEAKTLGQALNNAVTYGLGIMVGFFASGILFEKIGAPNLFLICSGLSFAGGLILFIEKALRSRGEKQSTVHLRDG